MNRSMKRWCGCLVFLAAVGLPKTASALPKKPIAFTLQGIYMSPMKPEAVADVLSDGWAIFAMPEFQVNPFLGLGAGYEYDHFYWPGRASLRAADLFLGGRFHMPGRSGDNIPYFLATLGTNGLPKTGDHWRGNTRASIGLGTRLGVVPGFSFDLGVHQHWMFPRPYNMQYVEVRWGIAMEFGEPEPPPAKKPTQAPSPTVTTTATVGSPTATRPLP